MPLEVRAAMAFKPPGQCPACGEWVPRGAVACDDCGACARSGWSDDSYLDGVDLPEDGFDYDEFVEREFGRPSPAKRTGLSPGWWWVAVILLLALGWALLAGLF